MCKRKSIYIKLNSIILLLLPSLFCIQCQESSKPEIVAEYQDIKITLSDFERSYFKFWQTTHEADSPKLRKLHARQMIEQELLARAALNNGVINESQIARYLERERSYFLRRRYLEVTVKDTITPISEKQISEAIDRQNKRMRVRQLYARTEQEIHKLQQRLYNGEKFEDIARQTLPDKQMAQKGGDLGWIGWGDTDLPVEEVLYTMEKEQISRPVQSLMGWHIFKIDSVQITYNFRQAETPFLRKDASMKLFNRKLDMAAAAHLRDLVWTKELAINTKIMKSAWNYLAPLLPQTAKERALYSFNNLELNLEEKFANQILAAVDQDPYTVGEFIQAIPDIPRYLLKPNLKNAIEVAIRDKIVTQEALKAGFDQDAVVQAKMKRARISFLYYAALSVKDSLVAHKVGGQKIYYLPDDEIKDRLALDAQRTYYDQLHIQLLPSFYNASTIIYNEAMLVKAFTEESDTIF
jgi:hypothetical protein